VNTEEIMAAVMLEEEKYDDLQVYCMSEGVTDIFKKRKGKGYYSSLTERYLMDGEMKFRELFQSFEGHFPFHLE
jgi:hypothetical protein